MAGCEEGQLKTLDGGAKLKIRLHFLNNNSRDLRGRGKDYGVGFCLRKVPIEGSA